MCTTAKSMTSKILQISPFIALKAQRISLLLSSVIIALAEWLHNVVHLKIKTGLGCFPYWCKAIWHSLPPNVLGPEWNFEVSVPTNEQLTLAEWSSNEHKMPCNSMKSLFSKCTSDYSRTQMYICHKYFSVWKVFLYFVVSQIVPGRERAEFLYLICSDWGYRL